MLFYRDRTLARFYKSGIDELTRTAPEGGYSKGSLCVCVCKYTSVGDDMTKI